MNMTDNEWSHDNFISYSALQNRIFLIDISFWIWYSFRIQIILKNYTMTGLKLSNLVFTPSSVTFLVSLKPHLFRAEIWIFTAFYTWILKNCLTLFWIYQKWHRILPISIEFSFFCCRYSPSHFYASNGHFECSLFTPFPIFGRYRFHPSNLILLNFSEMIQVFNSLAKNSF